MSKQTSTLTLTQCDPPPLKNAGYAYDSKCMAGAQKELISDKNGPLFVGDAVTRGLKERRT